MGILNLPTSNLHLCSLCCGCLFLCVGSRVGGVGWSWVCCGIFLCQNTLSILFLCYILSNFFMKHFYAHIYINCFLSRGNWCSQFMGSCKMCVCVCGCSQLHGFIFFSFSGAHSLLHGLLFSLAFGGLPVAL